MLILDIQQRPSSCKRSRLVRMVTDESLLSARASTRKEPEQPQCKDPRADHYARANVATSELALACIFAYPFGDTVSLFTTNRMVNKFPRSPILAKEHSCPNIVVNQIDRSECFLGFARWLRLYAHDTSGHHL